MRAMLAVILLTCTANAAKQLPHKFDPSDVVEHFEFWYKGYWCRIVHYNGTRYHCLPVGMPLEEFGGWLTRDEIIKEMSSNRRNRP